MLNNHNKETKFKNFRFRSNNLTFNQKRNKRIWSNNKHKQTS